MSDNNTVSASTASVPSIDSAPCSVIVENIDRWMDDYHNPNAGFATTAVPYHTLTDTGAGLSSLLANHGSRA